MPERPVLIHNLRPGPTTFTEDVEHGRRIDWAACGDPDREDVQPVPYHIATGDVNFLRAMGKGVFGVHSENDESAKNAIEVALERFGRAKPAADDPDMTDQERKFGKLEVIEMNEETTQAGKIGQDREDRIPVSVEPLQRG